MDPRPNDSSLERRSPHRPLPQSSSSFPSMNRAFLCAIACWCVSLSAQTDPILDRVIESQGKARVVIALRLDPSIPSRTDAIQQATSLILQNLDPGQIQVNATFQRIAALIATIGPAALTALRANSNVTGVEWDGGGYGIEVDPQPVNKLDRVAILDTGIPLSAEVGAPDKLQSESCFCSLQNGAGCCPDGSRRQNGPGSSRDDLPFATTSVAWLQPALPPGANVVSWAPSISVVKVLSRQDKFDSWEPILTAIDQLLDGTGNLNRVLFSFASSRLYLAPECSSSPAAAILHDAIAQFRQQGIIPIVARASGGPGPGRALPGCLESAEKAQGRITERLPKPDIAGDGMTTGNPGNPGGGPPPAPVASNGSAVFGVLEALAPLPDEEIPPVDTPANVKWWRLRIRVHESIPLQTGLANLVPRGQVLDFKTYDSVAGLAVGQDLKFSAAQTGTNIMPAFYATGFRLMDVSKGKRLIK